MQKKNNNRISFKELFEKSYNLKTFARSESDCTLGLGLSSLIKNISNTRESNLLLHFFKMLKLLLKSSGAGECLSVN